MTSPSATRRPDIPKTPSVPIGKPYSDSALRNSTGDTAQRDSVHSTCDGSQDIFFQAETFISFPDEEKFRSRGTSATSIHSDSFESLPSRPSK